MTLYQFNTLHQAEQHEALWKHGTLLGDKIKDGYKIVLYSIFYFYVEIYFHIKDDTLKRLISFLPTNNRLDAYLKQFDLTDLKFLLLPSSGK